MINIRPAQERGHFDHGWLKTYHTFSFADYYDPAHMGFRDLRVINEDWVQPGQGFGTHPHRDMEIITYVLDGALEHKDSMGNGSVILPGEVQRMSAGTGITHSEFNHSENEPVHLLQIWILPGRTDMTPSYEQKMFSDKDKSDRWLLAVSPEGKEGSVKVHQDVSLYVTRLSEGAKLNRTLDAGRHAWVQAVGGHVLLNGHEMKAGDGAAISEEKDLQLTALSPSELLCFDLR